MKRLRHTNTLGYFSLLLIVFNSCLWAKSFPCDLYKQAMEGNKNIVISPYGTMRAFAIAFIGSQGNTSNEIARVFGFSKNNSNFDSNMTFSTKTFTDIANSANVEVISASALWPDKKYSMESAFLNRAKRIFDISVSPVDFSDKADACATINNWVSQSTNDKFSSIISPSDISSITSIIITSAVYFKGKWEKQFTKQQTNDKSFYLGKTDSIQVPTMHQTERFNYWENSDIQYLKMSYIDNRISMSIALPKKRDGLSNFEKVLSMDSISAWDSQSNSSKVEVFLPRFDFSTNSNIKHYLINLGIEAAFNYKIADFSKISGHHDSLFIEKVLQKALIKVDEEGTEASGIDAILAGIGGLRSTPPPPIPVFRADHPFFFFIKENSTGEILFIGRVINPLKR